MGGREESVGKKSALLGDLLPVTSCAKRKSASNLRSGGFFSFRPGREGVTTR